MKLKKSGMVDHEAREGEKKAEQHFWSSESHLKEKTL